MKCGTSFIGKLLWILVLQHRAEKLYAKNYLDFLTHQGVAYEQLEPQSIKGMALIGVPHEGVNLVKVFKVFCSYKIHRLSKLYVLFLHNLLLRVTEALPGFLLV